MLVLSAGCLLQEKPKPDIYVQKEQVNKMPVSTATPTPTPEPTQNYQPEIKPVHVPVPIKAGSVSLIPLKPVYLTIPRQTHIERCQNYFLNKYSRDYLNGLDRRTAYCQMIQDKIAERCLPEALMWIPMVETWFKNDAYSSSHAVGLWQLIPATAKTFGLRIDDWIDQRRDPEMATDAALDILEYLYDKMGDWYLALAAYNAGEGCVNRAIRNTGSRDYWVLARYKALPSQTRFYVSAILALAEISRDPASFGISIPECVENKTVMIPLKRQVNLWQLADKASLDIVELRRLNSSLKHAWTPPDQDEFNLRLPLADANKIKKILVDLPEPATNACIEHLVMNGETLSGIARQYKSTVEAIMALNHMNDYLIFAGKTLMIPAGLIWE